VSKKVDVNWVWQRDKISHLKQIHCKLQEGAGRKKQWPGEAIGAGAGAGAGREGEREKGTKENEKGTKKRLGKKNKNLPCEEARGKNL